MEWRFIVFPLLVGVARVKCDIFEGPYLGDGYFSSGHGRQSGAAAQLPNWAANRSLHGDHGVATNPHGRPLPSLTASQAIGTQGHILMQDFVLIEKMQAFNRERIPERVAHAKGAGAHGYFMVTHDVSKYTKANFLNGIGKKTPVFVRFSTAAGEIGTADTVVDHNGFAAKFYTQDGNFDLVGNSLDVFQIRDPMLFMDLSRTRKRNPQTNLKDPNMWWDITSFRPEMILHTMQLFSDLGRQDGYRRIHGFGVHAFKLVNSKGDIVFCKFALRTNQPAPALTRQRAAELIGINSEYKTQDLYDAIDRGDYPSWTLAIQVMTLDQAKKYPRNPFDTTKTWREEEFPYIPIGTMTLNRNPTNFFAEVEQSGFVPSNLVPGIEPSPDRMLAGRIFSYQDAIVYRLGINWAQLPINRPVVPVNTYARDGKACYGNNGGGHPNYHPNSWGGVTTDPVYAGQPAFRVEGIVDRFDEPDADEHYEARVFLERDVSPDPAHRARLVEGIAHHIRNVRKDIRERALKTLFYPISRKFGDEVRVAIDKAIANVTVITTDRGSSPRHPIHDWHLFH